LKDQKQESDNESWVTFERAVDAVVKGGPQHKPTKKRGSDKPVPEPKEVARAPEDKRRSSF
jgi:hypothetical protein